MSMLLAPQLLLNPIRMMRGKGKATGAIFSFSPSSCQSAVVLPPHHGFHSQRGGVAFAGGNTTEGRKKMNNSNIPNELSSPSHITKSPRPLTASLIIIGNEVLSGATQDKNLPIMTKFCSEKGYQLHRVEILPDVITDIVQSVRSCCDRFDLVVTTGGIGPTHDDVSYEAIAQAFNDELQLHKGTVEKMKEKFSSSDLTPQRLRMAHLPSKAVVLTVQGTWVPLVSMNWKCFVFPGIPSLFEQMLTTLKGAIPDGPKLYRSVLFTHERESDIADYLRDMEQQYEGKVQIGSYPCTAREKLYNVMVSISSYDEKTAEVLQQKMMSDLKGFAEIPSR